MTPDAIAARLAQHAASPGEGDHLLSGLPRPEPPLKPAAVLVGIVARVPEPTVILTQRTAHLADHAGQISFPGGRIEQDDQSPEAAALREAAEEIGLAAGHARLLGRLPVWETTTGYHVTPVVAALTPPFDLTPDPHEVAEIFEIPLSFVLDAANHQLGSRLWQGRQRQFYVLPFQDRYIWGATAGMLVTLARVLTRP